MQKYISCFLFGILLFSCHLREEMPKEFRNNFNTEEQKIIDLSKDIIEDSYYGTFITIDKQGQPRARIMEPFAPDENFIIWLATNPNSRKVDQLKANSSATMHYFDKNSMSYVSLMGQAILVNDEEIKATKWRDGWERFYKNQTDDYLLIQFTPKTLELISVLNHFTGDTLTWKPHLVALR